jgi:FtsP/CotA-like multicopper oxidase with cupredoxin domain
MPADLSRREFLWSAGALVAAGLVQRAPSGAFTPDVELRLTAKPAEVAILPRRPTRVWRYDATLVKGPASTLTPQPGSYLGPTIRVRTGQKVRVTFSHTLPEPTIVHWHGLYVPAAMDGHPRLVIPGGRTYTYEFEVANRAGTYWYHPHHHDRTGPQVHSGLAGLFIVDDDEAASAGLPAGDRELAWVLQDRRFDANNQFVYLGGMPMEAMNGFLGDRLLVNGRAFDEPLALEATTYRVRLLNGSNSRMYKLAWGDGTPLVAIGTDGGLLERPVTAPSLVLAPGERIELLLDLRERQVGTTLELRSLAFSGVELAMGGGGGRGRGMGGGGIPPNGAPWSVLRIRISGRGPSAFRMPERLSTYDRSWAPAGLARLTRRTRTIGFARMEWMFDGRVFEAEGVEPDEIAKVNTSEVWEFANTGGGRGGMVGGRDRGQGRGRGNGGGPSGVGAGMRVAHPIHLHGAQFRVLSRVVDDTDRAGWTAMQHDRLDAGWKDTTVVMPGERVRFLVRFPQYTGLFLYHCHNLEHEDMGMMRNYRVDA